MNSESGSFWEQIKPRLPIVIVIIGALCTARLVWNGFHSMNASNGQVMTPAEIQSIMEAQAAQDRETLDAMWKKKKAGQ